MTSCWGVKNSVLLHDEEGYDAEGVPHEEVSILLVALDTELGTLDL